MHNERLYTKLGAKIKQLRGRRGINQQDLADKLDLSRSSLSQIENGERKIAADELLALSSLLGVDVQILLGTKKEPEVHLEKEYVKKQEEAKVRINVPQENVEKFKEVLLYLLSKVGSKAHVGETVIYKLLYFIDFDYYERYEEQLMGANYIKNHYGPTPVEFGKIVKDMKENKEIEQINSEYFSYPQTKYLPLREPSLSVLNASEVKMIDDVIDKLSHMNATELSAYSHEDVPWMSTEDGEPIEYESVFYRTAPYSVREYKD